MKTNITTAGKIKTFVLYGFTALLVFFSGGLLAGYYDQPDSELAAYDETAGMGGDFTLTDHNGARVNLKDYRGKVVVMFFGFINCPVVCPTTLNDMSVLMESLGERASQLQVLFVSVDPDRDTPEQLKEYVTHFNPSFVGLTGSMDELKTVTRKYGSRFMIVKEEGQVDYDVAHSVYLYVIDKKGEVDDIFHFQTPLEQISVGIEKLLAS